MTHVDLFSGIGGFALAAQACGLRTVQFCEIDKRCQSFLSRAWPGVPIHDDIKTFCGQSHRGAFLLTAGVPCQPASRAGKQGGASDVRWLWPEALRVLAEVQPAYVIFENPPGIGDVGLDGVLAQVEAQGYSLPHDRGGRPVVFSIPACAVGAPHRRERYWIVAKSNGNGRIAGPASTEATGYRSAVESKAGVSVANTATRQHGKHTTKQEWRAEDSGLSGNKGMGNTERSRCARETGEGMPGTRWTQSIAECGLGRESLWSNYVWLPCTDGKVRRAPDDSFGLVDGLQCPLPEMVGPFHRSLLGALGNSIVPQVAERIIQAIVESEP